MLYRQRRRENSILSLVFLHFIRSWELRNSHAGRTATNDFIQKEYYVNFQHSSENFQYSKWKTIQIISLNARENYFDDCKKPFEIVSTPLKKIDAKCCSCFVRSCLFHER